MVEKSFFEAIDLNSDMVLQAEVRVAGSNPRAG